MTDRSTRRRAACNQAFTHENDRDTLKNTRTCQVDFVSNTKYDYEDILNLAIAVFRTLPRNFWWKVLPDEEEDDDLSVGTGRPWKDLLPLLYEAKLLTPLKYDPSKYGFNKKAWGALAQRLSSNEERFEWSFYTKTFKSGRRRSMHASYYIIIGDKGCKSVFFVQKSEGAGRGSTSTPHSC